MSKKDIIRDNFLSTTKVGDCNITRGSIMRNAQSVDPTIPDGDPTAGREISKIKDEFLSQTGKGSHGHHIYDRTK